MGTGITVQLSVCQMSITATIVGMIGATGRRGGIVGTMGLHADASDKESSG